MAKDSIAECGIYSITNVITGKRYIGQSINITERKWQHFKELKANYHHCAYLQRSYNKHGRDNFTHDILELCERYGINEREQYWIDYFSPTGIYNTAKVAGSPAGIKRSDESRKKISLGKTGFKHSEETKQKMRESQAKVKEQKSIASKLQWSDPEAIRKISEKRKGRVTSDETKKKLSEGLIKRWSNPEYKNKLSETHRINWEDPIYRENIISSRKK